MNLERIVIRNLGKGSTRPCRYFQDPLPFHPERVLMEDFEQGKDRADRQTHQREVKGLVLGTISSLRQSQV